MGSRPDWNRIERELREAEAAARIERSAKARDVIERWNEMVRARRSPGHWPSIGLAISAGFYFLDVFCPGCRQVSQVDLRRLDRHPDTRLENLIPALSCRSCSPNPPLARIRGVSKHQWVSPNRPAYLPKRGL